MHCFLFLLKSLQETLKGICFMACLISLWVSYQTCGLTFKCAHSVWLKCASRCTESRRTSTPKQTSLGQHVPYNPLRNQKIRWVKCPMYLIVSRPREKCLWILWVRLEFQDRQTRTGLQRRWDLNPELLLFSYNRNIGNLLDWVDSLWVWACSPKLALPCLNKWFGAVFGHIPKKLIALL